MIPKFEEKPFLLFLLSKYEAEYGLEERHISNYSISPLSSHLHEKFPEFDNGYGHTNSDLAREWLDEAKARGFLTTQHTTASRKYFFSKKGFLKAKYYKQPIRSFYKSNWKWLIPIVLNAFLGVFAILRYVNCK